MPKDDWFRHTTWSAADRQSFFARLKRSRSSRNKAQYLRIQAAHLAEAGYITAAIELLDQILLDHPEGSELAQTHLQKAECLVELNNLEEALNEFRSSLRAERSLANVRTSCWIEFPWFIVRQEQKALFDEALAILREFGNEESLVFPVTRYRYSAAQALIAEARGDKDNAREFARAALEYEKVGFSGFKYHPTLGLVEDVDPRIHSRLLALALDDTDLAKS
jgi:tetratricopeptide (TPR) repeat protein